MTSGASGSKDEGRERSGQSPCVVHKDAAGNSFQPDVPNSQKVYRHLKINTPLSASKTMNDKAGAPSLHLCIVGFLTSTTCRYQFSKHKVGVSWSSLATHWSVLSLTCTKMNSEELVLYHLCRAIKNTSPPARTKQLRIQREFRLSAKAAWKSKSPRKYRVFCRKV